MPLIFLTAHGDVPMTARAMKAAAFDFHAKPFHDQNLLDSISDALKLSGQLRNKERLVNKIRLRPAKLSERECAVLIHVAGSLRSRQIAKLMQPNEVTLKRHRSIVMRKMNVGSLAKLVKISTVLCPSMIDAFFADHR